MSDGLQGRHALITGGGSGIGAATARALAAEGAMLSLLGRRREPLDALAREIPATAITCDVTDRAKMERAFADARETNGPIDLLILNAGIGDSAPFARTSRETFLAMLATNLTAVFDGLQLALDDLLSGEDKRAVVTASVSGLRGAPMASAYAASKHGVIGLVRSVALEHAKNGLTINAVCPAFVDTPMTDQSTDRIVRSTGRSEDEARQALASMNPNGRLVTADEVAEAILFLCQPSSRSITGSCLTIDGGVMA